MNEVLFVPFNIAEQFKTVLCTVTFINILQELVILWSHMYFYVFKIFTD